MITFTSGFFFVRTQKKLKGAKTQENGNSRKKTQTQEKISIFRHFLGQKEKKPVK